MPLDSIQVFVEMDRGDSQADCPHVLRKLGKTSERRLGVGPVDRLGPHRHLGAEPAQVRRDANPPQVSRSASQRVWIVTSGRVRSWLCAAGLSCRTRSSASSAISSRDHASPLVKLGRECHADDCHDGSSRGTRILVPFRRGGRIVGADHVRSALILPGRAVNSLC
jgi:hypothetical protein